MATAMTMMMAVITRFKHYFSLEPTQFVCLLRDPIREGLESPAQCTRLDPGAALRPQTAQSFDCLDAESPSRIHSSACLRSISRAKGSSVSLRLADSPWRGARTTRLVMTSGQPRVLT
jgi:hypothetical protein